MLLNAHCPHCGTSLTATADQIGSTIACPGCKAEVTVREPEFFDFLLRLCFNCGKKIVKTATVCHYCEAVQRGSKH